MWKKTSCCPIFKVVLTVWLSVGCGIVAGLLVVNVIEAVETNSAEAVKAATTLPEFETWQLVDEVVGHGQHYRLHIVSPANEWYIIPPAHEKWAAAITDGETVVLPETIRLWRTPTGKCKPLPYTGSNVEYIGPDDNKVMYTRTAIRMYVRR